MNGKLPHYRRADKRGGGEMKELIEVFRMNEIAAKTRARIIIKLGIAINDQQGRNITEPIVYELVQILDPENEILKKEHYLRFNK